MVGWFWLGAGQNPTRKPHGDTDDTPSQPLVTEKELRFFPYAWLGIKPFVLNQMDTPGLHAPVLRPSCVLPNGAPIFRACRRGDLRRVQRLIEVDRDLLGGMTTNDYNLLHASIPRI